MSETTSNTERALVDTISNFDFEQNEEFLRHRQGRVCSGATDFEEIEKSIDENNGAVFSGQPSDMSKRSKTINKSRRIVKNRAVLSVMPFP